MNIFDSVLLDINIWINKFVEYYHLYVQGVWKRCVPLLIEFIFSVIPTKNSIKRGTF